MPDGGTLVRFPKNNKYYFLNELKDVEASGVIIKKLHEAGN